METSTKNQNEQQKAITSNKRHLPVLVFEIELILSQKQERATKSSKTQRTANGNTHQKPKRATKSNKEHFSFPFSFIRTSSGPVEGGLYQEQWKARKSNDGQRKAMKSSKKLRRATKSNNGHQSWKNQNGQEKTKTSNEGHKKSKWKPGFRFTQSFSAKISGLSADLAFIKALKLLVAFIFEIQEYLDANDYVHTIYFESEVMINNFNSASEFLWSYCGQRHKTDDPLSLPKSLFWTLFSEEGTMVLMTQNFDSA